MRPATNKGPGQGLSNLTWARLEGLSREYQDIEYVKGPDVQNMELAVVEQRLKDVTDCDIVLTALTKELLRRDELQVVDDKKSLAAATKEVTSRKARLGTLKGYLQARQAAPLTRRRPTHTTPQTVAQTESCSTGNHDGEEFSPPKNSKGLPTSRDEVEDGDGEDSSSSQPPSTKAATGGEKLLGQTDELKVPHFPFVCCFL